ncbi:SAM-dependent methyltransferase [Sporomusaceae bacterium BoRhaA]|uniref:methyltransferase n=1 Tax=Pelorhabdus rhamnosifermentans TaxID=2772457 RepID=UPI001C061970|nr:methyltransferase [Pelorhabdus rhamnosifermentans]MBU2703474.1 SAM-dependent methyltransferase [Pelorhabdus rhamnosifermentans]
MTALQKSPDKLYLPLPVNFSSLMNLTIQRQIHDTIAVALELGIFEQLNTSQSAPELAAELNLDAGCTFYVLKVLVQAGYVAEEANQFVNLPVANNFLRKESYLYLGHEFIFLPSERSFSGRLAIRLRNISPEPTLQARPEPDWNQERLRQLGVFGLMGSIQSTVNAVDLTDARTFLDIGGGHGFYSIAFAQKYPQLQTTVFDLPHIVSLAERFAQQFGVDEQAFFRGGNFLSDDLGQDYDVVLCANVLHGHKRNILLSKVWQALRPGGKIIVKCRVDDSPDNLENAVTRLVWQIIGGRDLYSIGQWKADLIQQGFHDVTLVNQFGIYATITGYR